jgi:hypothetical protein
MFTKMFETAVGLVTLALLVIGCLSIDKLPLGLSQSVLFNSESAIYNFYTSA